MIGEREKVVIDTNALISALISPKGTVALAVTAALQNADVLQSAETFAELGEKLGGKKLSKYISPELRQQAMTFFSDMASFVEAPAEATACRDAKDNKFLDLAHAGGATTLISGDKDLQVLQGQERSLGYAFNIVSPREYADAHPVVEPARPASSSMFSLPTPAVSG